MSDDYMGEVENEEYENGAENEDGEEIKEEEPKIERVIIPERKIKRRTKIITTVDGTKMRVPVKQRNISEKTLEKLRSPENLKRLEEMRMKGQMKRAEKKKEMIKRGVPVRPPTLSQMAYIPSITKEDVEEIISSKMSELNPTLKSTVKEGIDEYKKTKPPKEEKRIYESKFNFNDVDELEPDKEEFLYKKLKMKRKEAKEDKQNTMLDELGDRYIF